MLEKLGQFENWLKKEERVVVAFSGGVDSALLAYVANRVLGKNMIAVTGESESVPSRDMAFVKDFAGKYGIDHTYIMTDEFKNEEFRKNPENRCYHCKGELFRKLSAFAKENGYRSALDGTNTSDLSGHRPGYNAFTEIPMVKVPFVELGITKSEIREMARHFRLEVAEKPASACLSSRIPWGTDLDPAILKRIDAAENHLRDIGFTQIRVRHNGDVARIQLTEKETLRLIDLRREAALSIKELGWKHVVIDLEYYGE